LIYIVYFFFFLKFVVQTLIFNLGLESAMQRHRRCTCRHQNFSYWVIITFNIFYVRRMFITKSFIFL